MVHRDPGVLQPLQSVRLHDAVRCAEDHVRIRLVQRPVALYGEIEVSAGQCASGRHERVAVDAVRLRLPAVVHKRPNRQKAMHLTSRMMVRRLRTEFAVLAAPAGPRVDDAAQVRPVAAQLPPDQVRAFAQLVQIGCHQPPKYLRFLSGLLPGISPEPSSFYDLFRQFANVHDFLLSFRSRL